MTSLFREYNPRSVVIPSTIFCVLLITSFIVYMRSTGPSLAGASYTSFLYLSGGMLLLTVFFLVYNAIFLQISRFQAYGFVVSIILYAIASYYILTGIFSLNSSLRIDTTFFSFFYAGVAMYLLTLLAEFKRFSSFVLIFTFSTLIFSVITSRTLLTADVVRNNPILERFVDISFWNLASIITVGITFVLAFLSANLLLEQLKKTRS